MGPHRVWLGDVWLPGLAMSRAMGDTMARRYTANRLLHLFNHTDWLYILPELVLAHMTLCSCMPYELGTLYALQSISNMSTPDAEKTLFRA